MKDKTIEITIERLEELEDSEEKLQALEAGGVDNWDGYDFALEDYNAARDRKEKLKKTTEEILSILGNTGYEPSERGTGLAFPESSQFKVKKILESLISEIK